MNEDPIVKQTMVQKKIAFAQSGHLDAVLAIFNECTHKGKLVGDTEYDTLVNAITMDAQAQLLIDFIASVDSIKQGGLLTTES